MGEPSFLDRTDFENADRGFVDSLRPGVVKAADGRTVWDNDAYGFLSGDPADTVNASLWRQAQLCSRQGLYEVTDGIYQVRGLDLSNMTLVEGMRGVIVIDPLISAETAAAALALYRKNRGDRPVTAVIYTHSHADHFGGVDGVLPHDAVNVPIVAPEGFLEHAVSENVYAGNAMSRRAVYMYGSMLPVGPDAQVGCGLGQAGSSGSIGLRAPTIDITHTGQVETLDGVRTEFQLTPGTEAPSEMNFLFPHRQALCMAENATHNLHNVLTLRGALVRDARAWSRFLNEAITLFAARADVAFASHHWPTWGNQNVVAYLSMQRDLYAYLHDQTVRLLNEGYTGAEIAEMIQLPPALESSWAARGYYGSVSHNVKAIYQRYMGWFDGNPANLWQHPPTEAATRYVECMGGIEAVVNSASSYLDRGDPRFAAELCGHAVFADPEHAGAKELLAKAYEQMGFGAENATWRNFYLTGAAELRGGVLAQPIALSSGMTQALSVEQLFDSIAVRIDGPRAWSETLSMEWAFTDLKEYYRMELSNGALIHYQNGEGMHADVTITLTKPQLLGMLAGNGMDGIGVEGDAGALQRLMSYLSTPDPNFSIVTP
jgi:alkyl sulfatase BDS1-like metallo-beta-lactamase superfamily hydrolase